MASKIKTGVIGVGSMGKNHARVYNEVSKLVGVSDLNEDLGMEIAKKYNIKYFKDYNDLLNEIDAVTIAVPTKYHLEVSIAAIKAGIHLLIEKPLASNFNDAKKILDLNRESKLVLSVGHIERHNPIVAELKNNIKGEIFGKPVTLSTQRFSSFPGRIVDVGVIFDLAIHDIDILCYLSGSKATSVYALGGRNKNESYEDFVSLLINFENGIKGLCEANWLTPFKVRKLSMTTDASFVEANFIEQSINVSKSVLLESDDFNPQFLVDSQTIELDKEEPLKNEIVNFLNAIEFGSDLLVTGNDGLQAVRIAVASVESIATGNKIYLDGD